MKAYRRRKVEVRRASRRAEHRESTSQLSCLRMTVLVDDESQHGVRLTVALSSQDFRGEVFRGTAERVRRV